MDGKRIFDFTVGSVLLIVTLPVQAVIAILVKLDSRGSSIFSQPRMGMHGQPFIIHKFRTMRDEPSGAGISHIGDPRITRVGAILRETKLDELPQLFDVVRGRMSLVGPRPELPKYVEHWSASDRTKILSVRPGMTDPASIDFRHEAHALAAVAHPEQFYVEVLLPEKVARYVAYVDSHSLLGDLRILISTLSALFRRPNTYADQITRRDNRRPDV